MTKLGRKTKELVSQGKLKLVPDSSRSPPPHVHLCEECKQLIVCYNRNENADFCKFTFRVLPCAECYEQARIGYARPKPISLAILANELGKVWLNKRKITNIMAATDPKFGTYKANKDRYWNTIYMQEISNIAYAYGSRSTDVKDPRP